MKGGGNTHEALPSCCGVGALVGEGFAGVTAGFARESGVMRPLPRRSPGLSLSLAHTGAPFLARTHEPSPSSLTRARAHAPFDIVSESNPP
eukprot:192218-Pleurochrysis_carterae.AAC.1